MAGFSLGADASAESRPIISATPVVAAMAVGTTVSLFVASLKAPMWGTILAGSAAALVTKFSIDVAGDRIAARGV